MTCVTAQESRTSAPLALVSDDETAMRLLVKFQGLQLRTGGAWGLAEGLRRAPPNAPPKIRLNAVLNSVTRRGPFLANNAGVVAMMYNAINSYIGYLRGKHDAANSIAAGALSGIIFKSTRGPRQMIISGSLVATIAGVWAVRRLQLHASGRPPLTAPHR